MLADYSSLLISWTLGVTLGVCVPGKPFQLIFEGKPTACFKGRDPE